MGTCCSSKLSQVHSPSANDRPGRDSKKRESESKNEAIYAQTGKRDPPTTTTADDVRAADEEVVICVGGGVEPPGTVPEQPKVSCSPPPQKPSPPKVEPEKPPQPQVETKPEQPDKLPVVPVETKLPVVPLSSKETPKDVSLPKDSEPAFVKSPSIEDRKPEAAASMDVPSITGDRSAEEVEIKPSFDLQAVSVLESEVKDVFDKYQTRIHADFRKTLDCNWLRLEQEIEKGKLMGFTLEWFWIAGHKITNAVEEADGLVVIKVQKGNASKRGEVVHLSIAGGDWAKKLPVFVDGLRQEMFKHLSIKAIHVTLWYSEQADTGKFCIDNVVESVFKERGFRWFQLTNSANGKRGQIMALKRTADDCEMPEEVWDLSVSLCMFIPISAGHKEDDDNVTVRPGGAGSRVMIAECLRRHVPENLKIEQTSEEQEGPTNQIEDVLISLNKRGKPVREICSKDTSKIDEAEEFFKECQCNTSLPSKTMSQVKTWLNKKEGVQQLICGGATVVVDWLERGIEMDPQLDWATYLRVPVRMLAKSPKVEHPLAYLGTNDDDIFIIVWPCKKDDSQLREDFLMECVNAIRNVEQIEDPLPFNEVLLPRFELQNFEASVVDIHKPALRSLKSDDIHRPKELVSVELSAGHTYRGALKKDVASAEEKKEPFVVPVTSTGSFVFCVWHAKLDDLEEPLFLARVDPSDWCKELS